MGRLRRPERARLFSKETAAKLPCILCCLACSTTLGRCTQPGTPASAVAAWRSRNQAPSRPRRPDEDGGVLRSGPHESDPTADKIQGWTPLERRRGSPESPRAPARARIQRVCGRWPAQTLPQLSRQRVPVIPRHARDQHRPPWPWATRCSPAMTSSSGTASSPPHATCTRHWRSLGWTRTCECPRTAPSPCPPEATTKRLTRRLLGRLAIPGPMDGGTHACLTRTISPEPTLA